MIADDLRPVVGELEDLLALKQRTITALRAEGRDDLLGDRRLRIELEQVIDDSMWPLPKFRELLFIK